MFSINIWWFNHMAQLRLNLQSYNTYFQQLFIAKAINMFRKIIFILFWSFSLVSAKSFLVLLGPAEDVQEMTPEEQQQFEDLDRTFVPWMRRLPNGDLLIQIHEEDLKYTLYKSGINRTNTALVILGLGAIFLILIIILFWRPEKNNSAQDEVPVAV